MKKILCMILVISALFSIGANAAFTIDERITVTPLTRGVTYTNIKRFTDSGWDNIHLVTADLKEDALSLKVLTNDKLSDKSTVLEFAAREENPIAVINADFFTTYKEGAANEGLTIRDGELITVPSNDDSFATLLIDENNNLFTDYFKYEIIVKSLSNGHSSNILFYNKLGPENYLKVFDSKFGTHSPGSMNDGYEVVVEDGIVTGVYSNKEGVEIPKNGYVLSHSLRHSLFLMKYFEKGDEVQLDIKITPDVEGIKNAISGGTVLVKEGKKASFTLKDERNPMTAVGFDSNNKLMYMLNVDGRASKARGMTFSEIAELFISYGCTDAISFDGGGSTAMALKKPGENLGHVNIQTYYRPVINALGLVSEIREDSIPSYLSVKTDKERVRIPDGIKTEARVFDGYMNEMPDEAVIITADKKGRFENNVFYPEETGEVTLTATSGKLTNSVTVTVMEKQTDENYIDPFYRHTEKEGVRIGLFGDNGDYNTLFTKIVTNKRNTLANTVDFSVFRQMPGGEITSQINSLSKYNEIENENFAFVSVNNNKGSVSSTDSSQWEKLFSFLERTEKENVFIMMPVSIKKNDADEATILTDKIKAELKGKNVFLVSYGDEYGYYYDDGIRYVFMKDLPGFDKENSRKVLDDCRYGVFTFSEEGISFEFLSYFE